MFGNSKEYQDIKKLYEEKVSKPAKPENINEITGGLGPIPNVNSNNNVKANNNNNVAPKTSKNIFQKIGDVLKSKPITGSRSRFNTKKIDTSNEIESSEAEFKANEGDKFNKAFKDANTDTSKEIESSSSEFKANEGDKVNQRFKKDVGIVRRSQQTGVQRAQAMANKRIADKKAGTYQKPKTAQELAKERIKAKEAGTYKKPKTAQELAKERIAAKKRLSDANIKVENYTPYDMVLEYLMSTQQVATIEEANYVMTEMDAETIQSIVEEQKKNLDEGLGRAGLGALKAIGRFGAKNPTNFAITMAGTGLVGQKVVKPVVTKLANVLNKPKSNTNNFNPLGNFIDKKRNEQGGGNYRVDEVEKNAGVESGFAGEKIYFNKKNKK